LWDWDVSANAVAWSDESYRQWGFTRDTFSGNVEEAVVRIHPEDRPRVEEAIRRVLAGGTEYTAQYRVVRPDRTTCWIDAYGVVVRERETRMLGIGIDITNLKKTEQARIAIVGELTASIAHEINQPLAAVVANGSASLRWLAIQPPNLEEARDAMTQAIAEANRTSDVIARIRSLLQKAPPQMGRIDVDQLIRAVLALSDNELLKGEVTVETELAADVPAVLGDRVQLQQVMLNLIMNAIDAMSTINHVPRRLLIKSVPHPDGVLIQVQDSGTGLDPEQLDRIFDPFFTTKPEGIGMGLSIARSMVEAHGGRLWATPASPRGAAFQFTLPAAPNE
jgi:PAS domain S-box-containing protein